jgi:large subunit ribosomal protein L3
MAVGLIGRKLGMTRAFDTSGVSVPVTVVHVETNRVSQIKTFTKDGYDAVQLATGSCKASKLNKALNGHISKALSGPARILREFKIDAADESGEQGKSGTGTSSLSIGSEYRVDHFSIGEKVDVVASSRGKGFAGTVKRHNFRTQDMTHGNSRSHRTPGSIGQNQTPGRVFKGKKMAGRMGNRRCTVQNLVVHEIDLQRNLLLIKGAIPGAPGGYILIKPSCKTKQGNE